MARDRSCRSCCTKNRIKGCRDTARMLVRSTIHRSTHIFLTTPIQPPIVAHLLRAYYVLDSATSFHPRLLTACLLSFRFAPTYSFPPTLVPSPAVILFHGFRSLCSCLFCFRSGLLRLPRAPRARAHCAVLVRFCSPICVYAAYLNNKSCVPYLTSNEWPEVTIPPCVLHILLNATNTSAHR